MSCYAYDTFQNNYYCFSLQYVRKESVAILILHGKHSFEIKIGLSFRNKEMST
jgi:hypothetical protein